MLRLPNAFLFAAAISCAHSPGALACVVTMIPINFAVNLCIGVGVIRRILPGRLSLIRSQLTEPSESEGLQGRGQKNPKETNADSAECPAAIPQKPSIPKQETWPLETVRSLMNELTTKDSNIDFFNVKAAVEMLLKENPDQWTPDKLKDITGAFRKVVDELLNSASSADGIDRAPESDLSDFFQVLHLLLDTINTLATIEQSMEKLNQIMKNMAEE